MKYQSELIKEIVESRGHELSSPHYESECVESWIEETKGAYPKLCDYQSEWLNYINGNHLGEFPYETVIDVTDATVNNVVPYEYKSAILKGQTLVNLAGEDKKRITIADGKDIRNLAEFSGSKEYTFCFNVEQINDSGVIRLQYFNGSTFISGENKNIVIGVNTITFTTPANTTDVRVQNANGVTELIIDDLMILEGDYTNADISYFYGMQSVKMPVLKTTGKNLFDEINGSFNEKKSINSTTGEITYYPNHVGVFENYIPVKPNTTYTLSGQLTDGNNPVFRVGFYQKDKAFNKTKNQYVANNGGNRTSYTFTTSENEHYIRFSFGVMTQGYFQLEEGTIATKYEPFKSNILTVNEDVTLRSNGSVYDELDLLTGKLTQHIDEDGSVLPQEVIKTVDLSIQDQDGNTLRKIKPIEGTMYIHSDGTPLKPTITMEIPVEATTQNLSSFIKEE